MKKKMPLWNYIAVTTAKCEQLCMTGDLTEQELESLGDFRQVAEKYEAYRKELIKLVEVNGIPVRTVIID